MAFTTDLHFLEFGASPVWTSNLFFLEATIDPAPAEDGDDPPFQLAWQGNVGELTVTCTCSTGASAVIPCLATSIVISQSESTCQTITVNLLDEDFLFHPEGTGIYNDVMVDGAEVSFTVTWGEQTRTFFGTFKPVSVNRSGGTVPQLTWVGTCEYDKLLKVKKTFETIAPNSNEAAPTNKAVLAEMCTAVDIDGDWSRIRTTRIGTPFHRQQLTPGDIAAKMLDLTVDEIRTENRTVEGYDPEAGGRRWEYDPDAFDVVLEQNITPVNNDPIDKVIVLRAVAAGTLLPNSEQNQALRLLEFGDGNSVSFDPPVSAVTWRYNARDYRAIASYFLFYNAADELIAARAILNPLDYSVELRRARIWNCTRVDFTWGAANPDVDADLLEAEGEIIFYGRSVPQTTVGEGEEANAPLDTTTRVVVGDGENEIELPPNPLFYGSAEMNYFGEKYLRRVGRQQIEYQYKLPLNHMIRLGDVLAVKRDAKLGGTGYIETTVTAVTHTISYDPQQRFTNVTAVKYAEE